MLVATAITRPHVPRMMPPPAEHNCSDGPLGRASVPARTVPPPAICPCRRCAHVTRASIRSVTTIAAIEPNDRWLAVRWRDGVVSEYPWVWLRDHDAAALHPVT